jgi:dihydrofolate reductase/thymidylate synthase
MGRKTFDTIGKPLPNRINYVLTRNRGLLDSDSPNLHYVPGLDEAIHHSTNNQNVERVFVIGGAEVYKETLRKFARWIDTTFLTFIETEYECDQFLDKDLILDNHHYPGVGIQKVESSGIRLAFHELRGRNRGEEEYLDLMHRILDNGTIRPNRTAVDTISVFGERMEFDISQSIPFLTTKRLAWKTMLRELLWFISGDTNNKALQSKNVHIWDGNSTRKYLDSIGLTDREEGDLGPVYGFQWRHFGADYVDCHTDYTEQGVDQLSKVVRLIKETPDSRRIIMSAWTPKAQSEMALPPCHLMAQWYVRDGKYLDCQMYQRSCDVALGVPFNIASYSVLTYMIAHVTGLHPGRYIQVLGDAHIYSNHVDAVKEQLERIPYQFPRLRFARQITDIDDFREGDFIVDDYQCHPTIKMDMAV